jgi:hypothetical protein
MLCYGHGDVIRGLEGQWRDGLSPWVLKQEGERWYGRGSADNKAQHSINMAALAMVIAERGRLGFNARFMLETGEEMGSPGLREFCDYLQHTTPTPQMVPTGSTVEDYIEWAMSTGSAVIGTYEDAIEQIESLQDQSNGGFGAFLLFDHNWANWNAKKHHYHLFGEFVIPHFKKTNRRLKSSELYARDVRDELAKAQSDAIGAFAAKHANGKK